MRSRSRSSSRSGTGSLEREDYENQKELEGSSSNSRALKGSNNSGNSGNDDDEQGSGWLGWWRRGMKGPAEAHLGSKSPYSYDQEAGRWVMGVGADSDALPDDDVFGNDDYDWDAPGGPKISDYQMQAHNNEESGLRIDRSRMTDEKLEEHGLVLAIQAAHVASTLGKANASPRGKSGKGGNVSRWGRQTPTSPRLAGGRSRGGASDSRNEQLAELSFGSASKHGERDSAAAPLLGGDPDRNNNAQNTPPPTPGVKVGGECELAG